MIDLGRYATEVLAAYGGALAALAILVAASIRAGRQARRRLDDVEARRLRDER